MVRARRNSQRCSIIRVDRGKGSVRSGWGLRAACVLVVTGQGSCVCTDQNACITGVFGCTTVMHLHTQVHHVTMYKHTFAGVHPTHWNHTVTQFAVRTPQPPDVCVSEHAVLFLLTSWHFVYALSVFALFYLGHAPTHPTVSTPLPIWLLSLAMYSAVSMSESVTWKEGWGLLFGWWLCNSL